MSLETLEDRVCTYVVPWSERVRRSQIAGPMPYSSADYGIEDRGPRVRRRSVSMLLRYCCRCYTFYKRDLTAVDN